MIINHQSITPDLRRRQHSESSRRKSRKITYRRTNDVLGKSFESILPFIIISLNIRNNNDIESNSLRCMV
jgi:hypothetical protein